MFECALFNVNADTFIGIYCKNLLQCITLPLGRLDARQNMCTKKKLLQNSLTINVPVYDQHYHK